jgi:alkylation response protein AidB-like acyl-CoA dehydrogenase
VLPDAAALTRQPSNDPSRRLFSVAWEPTAATLVADGAAGRALWSAALDRGALACAAQQLGVGQQLIDMAVAYACERKQFGVPIGTFQAIKHMLADVKVRVEYARSVVYRAAHSVARDVRTRSVDVSAAKVAACEAAVTAAKTALQVYGALGYTWEQDLHIWMRRAWSLDLAWGDGAWHRARVADAVIDGALPAESFGYSAPGA